MDALGAGMQLANYDSDIRGAGNLIRRRTIRTNNSGRYRNVSKTFKRVY